MYSGTIGCVPARISIDGIFLNRSVWEILIFGNQADHIHAESVNPLFQPPVHHGKYFVSHLIIFPVQIWLFFREEMKKIHLRLLVILPGRPAKERSPVIRRRFPAVFPLFTWFPYVIIPVRIVNRTTAFYKPGMLV